MKNDKTTTAAAVAASTTKAALDTAKVWAARAASLAACCGMDLAAIAEKACAKKVGEG